MYIVVRSLETGRHSQPVSEEERDSYTNGIMEKFKGTAVSASPTETCYEEVETTTGEWLRRHSKELHF